MLGCWLGLGQLSILAWGRGDRAFLNTWVEVELGCSQKYSVQGRGGSGAVHTTLAGGRGGTSQYLDGGRAGTGAVHTTLAGGRGGTPAESVHS